MLIVRVLTGLYMLLIVSADLEAQIIIADDFSDGDLSSNPAWLGDTAFYEVTSNAELKLIDSLAGSRFLCLASRIGLEASWEWRCRLDFNPSSSNYLKVYLVSDDQNLQGSLNGYFIRIGGSSADKVSLFRQDGQQTELLIESPTDWTDRDPLEIAVRVTRDARHKWEIHLDTTNSGSWTLAGSVSDSTYLISKYFGLCPNYTSTRSDRFYFDDFLLTGLEHIDNTAPRVLQLGIEDSLTITLEVSEPIDLAALGVSFTDGVNVSGIKGNGSILTLELSKALIANQQMGLQLTRMEDANGNSTDTLILFRYVVAEPGDVVINEIMADPTPSVGIPPWDLPESEYLELRNNLPWPVDLRAWRLEVGSRSYELPSFLLDTGAYVVLTREEATSGFGDTLSVLGLSFSASALTNSGTSLVLYNAQGTEVSRVTYDESYYQNQLKAQGGWSLERLNPAILCNDRSNWRASGHPNGGTPGRENSWKPKDFKPPAARLEALSLIDLKSLGLSFSMSLDPEKARDPGSYELTGLNLVKATWQESEPNRVHLEFAQAMSPGEIYTLSMALAGCDGVPLSVDTVFFGLPQSPETGDLIINEVLFDPWPGGADYIELLNTSDKIIDLSRVQVGAWDQTAKAVLGAAPVCVESRLLLPSEYVLLTSNIEKLTPFYQLGKEAIVLTTSDMPAMPDDKGSIAVQGSDFTLIDHLVYTRDWHHPLMVDPEGVSLERLQAGMETQRADNWISAAETAGFGTPGYANSRSLSAGSGSQFSLEPKVFSPDLDGNDDVLMIRYQAGQEYTLGNFSIWNIRGEMVKQLGQQVLMSTEGMMIWDGTGEDGKLQDPGYYIVVMETFSVDEKRSLVRGTCVLSR